MTSRTTTALADIARHGMTGDTIADDTVAVLRRAVWSQGNVTAERADEILALNDRIRRPSAEWTRFFVEALTEFLMTTSHPRGHLSDAQADWLLLRIEHDGRIESTADLELLVYLIERMDSAPLRLKDFILAQVERAVVAGLGPTREDGEPEDDRFAAGRITTTECAIIRRVIFAPAGNGPARVSAEEADLLFRLKDATLGAANAPEWEALFVQGVANYLQGWQGQSMPTPEEELAHTEFLAQRSGGVRGFLGKMVRSSPQGLISTARGSGFGRKGLPKRDRVAEERADFVVTGAEQQWLNDRTGQDGQIDALEQALIAFLHEQPAPRI